MHTMLGVGLICTGAGLLVGVGAIAQRATTSAPAGPAARCELPAPALATTLSPGTADRIARWTMACADYEAGRIDHAAYLAERAELLRRSPASRETPAQVVWATEILDRSSEYTQSSWSASQALGRPDVYPRAGDDPNAWAPEAADGGTEHITLALSEPQHASAVELYETYNPGAVTRVELYDLDGVRVADHARAAAPAGHGAYKRTIELGCTDRPVASIKITLDTSAVPGWNELDAVGVRPCQP